MPKLVVLIEKLLFSTMKKLVRVCLLKKEIIETGKVTTDIVRGFAIKVWNTEKFPKVFGNKLPKLGVLKLK